MKCPQIVRAILESLTLPLLTVLALCLAFRSYKVNGPSMRNALQQNQVVSMNRFAYVFRTPKRGDVIVLRLPAHPHSDLIKRVIGIPEDSVTVDEVDIWVNGMKLDEPYVTQKYNPGTTAWKVPPMSTS